MVKQFSIVRVLCIIVLRQNCFLRSGEILRVTVVCGTGLQHIFIIIRKDLFIRVARYQNKFVVFLKTKNVWALSVALVIPGPRQLSVLNSGEGDIQQ